MTKTLITLQSALDQLDIKAYALYTACGIRQNTIYDYIKNKNQVLRLDYLTKIMTGLNNIAQEKKLNITYTYSDILKIVDDEEYQRYVNWVEDIYNKK